MEFHQLEYLVAIAEAGTVSRASEILLVSQPALTRAIQKLEDELGYPLFDRTKNRLKLNDNGELAVRHAKKILKEKEKMIENMASYQKSKQQISIGSCAPAPLWGLKFILHNHYPSMNIEPLINKDTVHLTEGLNNHLFSIIIVDHPVDDKHVISTKLFSETLHIAVKPDDPLSQRSSITFEQLNGTNILSLSITGYWMDICKEKLPQSIIFIQKDIAAYSALQKASSLPVFRTDITIHKFKPVEDRIYIPITDKEATLTFYAVYHKSNQNLFNMIEKELPMIPWNEYRNEDLF